MKIKINREIEVPNAFMCTGSRKECHALQRITNGDSCEDYAHCKNFNSYVFWSDKARFFIKCKPCIDATIDYLAGGEE